ncbi:NADPH-dependent FMN reductase [Sphaerisporangium aureirubrum]|uniref:NADPH-dependent FMN reductase n=1 Tax=Sphaerisporangium aureirubrum TaxID=1544736 RepID=A0ABW1NQL4_9ACTN
MLGDGDRLRVAVIIGSTRRGRFGPTVAGWFAGRAGRRGDMVVDVIDLAEAALPDTLADQDQAAPPPVRALAPRLAAADAFVVVTPEYNQSFPAPLKTAIDWYYEEWKAKPVTFVAYGRESGGLLAVAQLRQVFGELHAVPIRSCVSLPCYWEWFAADGSWPRAGFQADVKSTLDQLAWWALALREARARRPYTT